MIKEVSVIIPAYNEGNNILSVINDVRVVLADYDHQIIVVDDSSQDNTSEVAKQANVFLIRLPENQGKGAAFRKGIPAVEKKYVVQIDADHQFQPNDIPLLLAELEKGADIVLGSRFRGGNIEDGSVSMKNKFGNWLMSKAATLFSGLEVLDIMAGFKAFRTEVLKSLDLQTDHFGYEAEIVVKGSNMGYKISEVPITYTRRIDGISNVKSLRDGSLVLSTIFKTYLSCHSKG